MLAGVLQGSNHSVSRLQRCCKAQTIRFLVCNVVARSKPFGFLFAMLLQEPNYSVSCLQRCCKAQTIWFLVYNIVARPKPFGFSFATLLQGSNYSVSLLQRCCKAQTIWFFICGTPARLKPFGFLFAELPRGSNHWIFVCGSPAKPKPFINGFCRLFSLFLQCLRPSSSKASRSMFKPLKIAIIATNILSIKIIKSLFLNNQCAVGASESE